jgi:multidrug resistance efflux pump
MIVVLLNSYLVILFLLVRLKLVRFNLFWKCSPLIVLLLLMFGLFIPMGWGAPQGTALVVRNSVAIVPNVSGQVVEVPVQANAPLKAGDVLFRIDPAPFEYKVKELEAQVVAAKQRAEQLKSEVDAATANVAAITAQVGPAEKRRDDIARLAQNSTATQFRLQDQQKQVDTLHAQLDAAKAQETTAQLALGSQIDGVNTEVVRLTAQLDDAQWELDQTTVRAPADGYVTNIGLRKGARVTSLPLAPAMAFIDTSQTVVGVEIAQIDARYVAPGQPVELTFKFAPGAIYTGKVERVLQAIATGQVHASGAALATTEIQSAPFGVRVKLDDADSADRLPAGSTGDAAIFTDHVQAAHVIRKVLLRQIAITNYVNPF